MQITLDCKNVAMSVNRLDGTLKATLEDVEEQDLISATLDECSLERLTDQIDLQILEEAIKRRDED